MSFTTSSIRCAHSRRCVGASPEWSSNAAGEAELVQVKEQLHGKMLERVPANHTRICSSPSKWTLPNFKVGDYITGARSFKLRVLLRRINW